MKCLPPLQPLPDDWHDGRVPANAMIAETAYIETSYCFSSFRSELEAGLRIGHASSIYGASVLDVGMRGRLSIGDFVLVNGAWLTCDREIEIGDYTLISWNVVIMDTYRFALHPATRRQQLLESSREPARLSATSAGQAVRIGRNVWIGFDCCVLPGVTIGDGAVIGARSVVVEDVPPYSLAAGNPARVVRQLENDEPAAAQ
jgi:acetyltransferase-like isoleucine patch superfamily enzyme